MDYVIEQIIDDIKDSLDMTSLGYSGGQSVDRNYCPICGADEPIRYNSNHPRITMATLKHTNDCAYTLIKKLESKLQNTGSKIGWEEPELLQQADGKE